MKYDARIHHRRSVRLQGYDYARPGQYFVTVCAHYRELLFGEVVKGQMRRNALGDIVHAEWYATERIRPEIRLDGFIVIPNHFHGIIEIVGGAGPTRRVAPIVDDQRDDSLAGTSRRVAPANDDGINYSLVGARRRLAPTGIWHGGTPRGTNACWRGPGCVWWRSLGLYQI
jgi:hypothetical protein